MRKEYEAPKAEKMAFDYSDVVVASSPSGCEEINKYSLDARPEDAPRCGTTYIGTEWTKAAP